jgi:predicted nuclease of restriction endonuclease-like (RecB) superfamily
VFKREFYELESVNNAWTARETERQINAPNQYQLYLPTHAQLIHEVNQIKHSFEDIEP